MPAVLFGSISTLADTSELQREAFNTAFAEAGLDWTWDRQDYLAMLESSGGRQRISDYAAAREQTVDAEAIHASKSAIFQQLLGERAVAPRPGVVDVIQAARGDGSAVALVTTTTPENVASLLQALAPDIEKSDFDVIVDLTSVAAAKPDSAAYLFALDKLGVSPEDSVAIEDNLNGVTAAKAAGLACVAFPNVNTETHDFRHADQVLQTLTMPGLAALANR